MLADANDASLCHAPYDPEHNAQMLVYAANMAGEVAARLQHCWQLSGSAATCGVAVCTRARLGHILLWQPLCSVQY